jgi:hypothetical protein
MTSMNIKNFINYIINFNNIENILNNYKNQSEKGYIFERICDIIIKFGFCELFNNLEFNHMIGNVNNGKLKEMIYFDEYLNENIISGNSSGCSDITLKNKNNEEYIFISSKYPKLKEDIINEKSVDYYDIQKIVAMANKNKNIYTKFKIFLIVPNKKTVLEKVKNSNESSNYITEYMKEENILDINDFTPLHI